MVNGRTTQLTINKKNGTTNGIHPRIAVFASGAGSNFRAMLNDSDVEKHIGFLVCDKPGAPVIKIAEQHGISTYVFDPTGFENKDSYEKRIVEILCREKVEWIFLAGYMRIVGGTLLAEYNGKIVNVHPSYLPAFPGKDAIGQALRAQVTSTGVTVHFVDEGIDTGPVIEQEVVEIFPQDSIEQLTERIQRVEHKIYPKVIKQLLEV